MRELLSKPSTRLLVQLAISVLILWVLFRETDVNAVWTTIKGGSLWMLVGALLVKATGLLVHETRLWLALPSPRPSLPPVISLGLVAGVLNLVLPARAGDVAAIAMLDRECKVPVPVGTAAVGVTSFLEAALFAFFLMAVIGMGAARWADIVGEGQNPALWIGLALLCGCLVLATMGVLGKILRDKPASESRIFALAHQTLIETSQMVGSGRYLMIQSAAAAVQVVVVVLAFSLAMMASGANVAEPVTAASMVLAVSSLASFVLPPTMAAGPAAAASLVLPHFGADPTGALAYATVYWVVAHLPAVCMGLPALFARR